MSRLFLRRGIPFLLSCQRNNNPTIKLQSSKGCRRKEGWSLVVVCLVPQRARILSSFWAPLAVGGDETAHRRKTPSSQDYVTFGNGKQ